MLRCSFLFLSFFFVFDTAASPDSKFVNGTTEAFDRTTVMYAQGSQSRLGAHVTCLILLSAFVTFLLVRFQRSFLQGEAAFENKNNTRLESYSMMLERLPRVSFACLPPSPSRKP